MLEAYEPLRQSHSSKRTRQHVRHRPSHAQSLAGRRALGRHPRPQAHRAHEGDRHADRLAAHQQVWRGCQPARVALGAACGS